MRIQNLFGDYEDVNVKKSKAKIEVAKIEKSQVNIPQDVLEKIYNQPHKKYYSIGEVSELFGAKPSLLRYWEKKFTQIRPGRNANGVRKYTKKDIETLNTIHYFLKVRKWKINGVIDYLNGQRDNSSKSLLITQLEHLKKRLLDLHRILEDNSS